MFAEVVNRNNGIMFQTSDDSCLAAEIIPGIGIPIQATILDNLDRDFAFEAGGAEGDA